MARAININGKILIIRGEKIITFLQCFFRFDNRIEFPRKFRPRRLKALFEPKIPCGQVGFDVSEPDTLISLCPERLRQCFYDISSYAFSLAVFRHHKKSDKNSSVIGIFVNKIHYRNERIAVENADIVIMQDHPLKIYDAIKIAKSTRFVALFNIIFSLTIKLSVIILLLCQVLGSNAMLIAMLADTGLTVLMTINSLMLIYRKIK